MKINEKHAREFLETYYKRSIDNVELIGQGAWSRCFGYQHNGRELVIRFGKYLEDFEKDRIASSFNSILLPVPQLFSLGKAFSGFYAISTRAYGKPLENLGYLE